MTVARVGQAVDCFGRWTAMRDDVDSTKVHSNNSKTIRLGRQLQRIDKHPQRSAHPLVRKVTSAGRLMSRVPRCGQVYKFKECACYANSSSENDEHKARRRRGGRAVLAERLPHHVLACVFQYLSLRDLLSVMRVCRHWFAYLDYEDCEVWQRLCRVTLPEMALADPYLLAEVPTHKAKLRSFAHAWNPLDCSRNSYVKTNGFTLHRNPIAQSTDGARSKIGLNRGRHAWEVWWEGPLGTVAVVGVATKHAALQCPGYTALLGSDDQGWAWNLVDNTLLHNARVVSRYPLAPDPPRYQVGDKIRVVLDCDAHTMYFERRYEFLGVAFRDLPPVRLYPCVCAVYGNTEVTMVYLGAPIDG